MKNNSQKQPQQSQDSGCKIFVGGLTWNTTKEMLQIEFSKYGEIVDSVVMKNQETGNSRGFGFITYKESSSAENAVASGSHKIDGKIVDVKLCNPRFAAQQRSTKQKSDSCKVFVGGLPHGVTDDQIKQFFSRYGLVKEFKMMYDENKQRPRGFGFITFEQEESANKVLQEHYIQFNGKQIEVKPQLYNIKQHQQQQHQQTNQGYNVNSTWNQQIPPTQQSSMSNLAGSWVGYTNQNPPSGQQWGSYANYVPPIGFAGASNTQPNWNYSYYGQQTQQSFYQPADSSGTGNYVLQQQNFVQGNQFDSPNTVARPASIENYQIGLASSETASNNSSKKKAYHQQSSLNSITNAYLQDSTFLPTPNSHYKQSSSSSIAGTIGSNTNYSGDSDASSNSYYRGGSNGSNSSIAPSISSLASSSLVSNVSGSISDRSHGSSNVSRSSNSSVSHYNHHQINTSIQRDFNTGNEPNRNNRNSHHHHYHHKNQHRSGGGSVASSSATDISSVYSTVNSQANSDFIYNRNNTSNNSYSNVNTSNQFNQSGRHFVSSSSNYHPYRR